MPRRRRIDMMLKDQMRPTLDRFADDTSMLGFRYLHSRYKMWFRMMWAIVVLLFILLTSYQVYERITYYFIKNPLSTRRTYDTPQQMPFPTIGICNKMQLKASRIASRNAPLVKALCLAHTHDGHVTTNKSLLDSLNSFSHIDLLDIHRHSHQTVDELFLSCEFGKSGSCMDDIRPIYTPSGLCFAVSPNSTVRRPGPETTLSLLLNLEVYEIVPGMVADPGVILSIYDNQVALSAQYTEGIHLEAGKVVTIPINEVRRLSRYKSYCGRRAISPFARSEYSLAACQWAKSMSAIEKHCGCRPINSPYHRGFMIGNIERIRISNSTRKKFRRGMKTCNLRQELECVHPRIVSYSDEERTQPCPEECQDVSFSSVVFGGKLAPSEISSLLPSDWEDSKETRMADFQKALDVIPTDRIPVVRAIHSLAIEAQYFFRKALQVFDVHLNSTTIPCIIPRGVRIIDHIYHQLKSNEDIWEKITSYFRRSLCLEMKSTASAIGLVLVDTSVLQNNETFKLNSSTIALAFLQLGSMQEQLNNPSDIFGLRSMQTSVRNKIIKYVILFIEEMRSCIVRLQDNPNKKDEIGKECRQIFIDRYSLFIDAQKVYSFLDTTSDTYREYEEASNRIFTVIKSIVYTNRIRFLDWSHHDISLKFFRSLYGEGGKDHDEILELMKLRKLMFTEIVEMMKQISSEMSNGLNARSTFLSRISITDSHPPYLRQVQQSIQCLNNMTLLIPALKKNSFVRGEWLARVQRQIEVAQAYSATPQYDQVNLLHIKLYFAHFKQETIIQEKSYNMFLLLAEIGGTIGLYVGATLLTVAETIVFFFEKNTRRILVKPTKV